MRPREANAPERMAATVVLLAFVVVLLGSTGGFAADPDAAGEPCVGCSGCESGECGDDGNDPLTSHHHCCTACCASHVVLTLSMALSTQVPTVAEPLTRATAVVEAGRCPETPYRPPRI